MAQIGHCAVVLGISAEAIYRSSHVQLLMIFNPGYGLPDNLRAQKLPL